MRVDVTPTRASIVPGQPALFTVRVTNTRDIISGQRLRVLGVDQRWVGIDRPTLSLFPGDSGVALLTVTLPTGIPAGARLLTVEVAETTAPFDVTRVDVEVSVPAEPAVTLTLEPPTTVAGRRAIVSVVVTNTGNAVLDVPLAGRDDEGAITFHFDRPVSSLAPGEQQIGRAVLGARRPLVGAPRMRPFSVEAGETGAPVIAPGVWAQKARVSRGGIALFGLLAVATVFAVVIATSLSQVVHTSNQDRDLAVAVAQNAAVTAAGGGTGAAGAAAAGVSGTVTLLTSGTPVGGVTVQLYPAAGAASPLVSTATGPAGGYSFTNIPLGSYKLRFSGAGFSQLWYPKALDVADGTAVTVSAGKVSTGIDVRIGGLPGSIAGSITGGDPTGAVLTLAVPTPAGTTPPVVTTQTLNGAAFSFAGVPSPAVYQLSLAKAGFATTTQTVDLAGGQAKSDVRLQLLQGDGSVSGTVSGPGGPIGGATVTISAGEVTDTTVTSTGSGGAGSFTINDLPTPGTFTLSASAPGFATQTVALSLAADQQLQGESLVLTPGSGSISGSVSTAADGTKAGGVTVTASDGKTTVTTVSLSVGAVGSYTLPGLTVPDTWTVTFSRPDVIGQTRSVALLSGANDDPGGVDVALIGATTSVSGIVSDASGPVSQVAITLSTGSTTYSVTSTDVPTRGAYEVDGVAPGTYTLSATRPGGVAATSVLTIAAGAPVHHDVTLTVAASIVGDVIAAGTKGGSFGGPAGGRPVGGVGVALYPASSYPAHPVATTTTAADGSFSFANIDAPQDYVVAFAYPDGAAPQRTAELSAPPSVASAVCGSGTTPAPAAPSPPPSGAPACSPATIANDPVEVATA